MQQNWHEETSPRTFKSFLFPATQSPSSGGVGKSCDTFWKALMFYFRSIIGFFDQKSLNKELRIGLFIKWGWRSRGGFLVPILLHSTVHGTSEPRLWMWDLCRLHDRSFNFCVLDFSIEFIAPQGHFRRAGRSYLVGSQHVTV